MKLGSPQFGPYMVKIVMSFLISISLQSILLGISIATPAGFLGSFDWRTFLHPFTLKW